jgi:hypothetical protein
MNQQSKQTYYFQTVFEENPTVGISFAPFISSLYNNQHEFTRQGERYAYYQEVLQTCGFIHFSLPCFSLLDTLIKNFLLSLANFHWISEEELDIVFQANNSYQTKPISSIIYQYLFPSLDDDQDTEYNHLLIAYNELYALKLGEIIPTYRHETWLDDFITCEISNTAKEFLLGASYLYLAWICNESYTIYCENINIVSIMLGKCWNTKPSKECCMKRDSDFRRWCRRTNSKLNIVLPEDHKHGIDCIELGMEEFKNLEYTLNTSLLRNLYLEYIQGISIEEYLYKVVAAKLSKFNHSKVVYAKRFCFLSPYTIYEPFIEDMDIMIEKVITSECILQALKN